MIIIGYANMICVHIVRKYMHCMTAFVIKKFLFREFDFIHVELS